MGSFSIYHWLVVLLVILLVFGTKKLRTIGSDLGGALKGFKEGIRDGSAPEVHAPVTVSTFVGNDKAVDAARQTRS